MNSTTLQLGDTVSGTYYDVDFTGILSAYDASGYVYITFPEGFTKPVVCRIERDSIAIDPRHPDAQSLRLVSRPETSPEVETLPSAVLGGAYLAT